MSIELQMPLALVSKEKMWLNLSYVGWSMVSFHNCQIWRGCPSAKLDPAFVKYVINATDDIFDMPMTMVFTPVCMSLDLTI